jgi:hypothetical protein
MSIARMGNRAVLIMCEQVSDGPGPSEKVVAVRTTEGASEEVVVHCSQVRDQALEVSRIADRNGDVLVELPRESTSGNWRIWVSGTSLARAE